MNQESYPFSLGYINTFLPSVRARAYLECITTAGYHEVNSLYERRYPDGVSCTLMLLTLCGQGLFTTAGRTHVLEAGSMAIVPPDTPMRYRTSGDQWTFYWLNASGPRTTHIARTLMAEGRECFTVPSIEPCEQILHTLLYMESSKLTREPEISSLLNRLTDTLLTGLFFTPTPRAHLTEEIAAYLEEHCGEPVSLDELSRRFYLSPNRLIDIFREETGRTPYAYLMECRFSRARILLQTTDLPINEIARETGFSGAAHFSSQFRRASGLSPRAYRGNLRSKPDPSAE